MALGPYAEPWRIQGFPLRLPVDPEARYLPQPDGYLVLVGPKEWTGVTFEDPRLRLVQDCLESTVKSLHILSQMAETQSVIQSSQRIDQRDALHAFLQPLMNQELSIASAELAVQQGNRKEALDALQKTRGRMLRAASAARNYLDLAFADQGLGPQLATKDQWAQTELIVGKVIDVLEPEATSKRLTLFTNVRQIPKVPMREADLELVVHNLLHNAIKYSFSGSKIEILQVGREPEVVIDFVSHGIPIPQEDFENVFKVGFRTALASKMAFTAAGIGLPSARAKVRAQGGRLFVKSSTFERKVDEGDQFENVFRLRLHRDKKGEQ
ncbi:MAG: HAMP domain-containing histidine kinase [Verrucomicrobia bacterium]|nr:HAMP domain-containing histidine kinase [Verrucomicrobiota bacterium]